MKYEFEMKDLKKIKFSLGLQIEHFSNRIFVHQSMYREKVSKHFYMDNAHTLNTHMVVRSLDTNKKPFRPLKEDEEILDLEVPYLNAIGTLMYLVNCIRPNIAFTINLLARYSSTPTKKHWNEVKHIPCYLRETTKRWLSL